MAASNIKLVDKLTGKRKYMSLLANWTSSSVNRRILSASVIISLMTLMVKFMAFGKEVLVARQFGTGDALDAYFIAFLLPYYCINVVAGSFGNSLIPTLARAEEQGGEVKAQRVMRELFLLALGLLVCLVFLLYLAMPFFLPLIASSFSPEKFELTRTLCLLLSPLLVISGISMFAQAVLNSRYSFAIPAMLPILTPIAIIISIVFYIDKYHIYTLLFGALFGATIEMLVLVYVLKRAGWSLFPRWYGIQTETIDCIKQYTPMVMGAVLLNSTVLIDQGMAATLESGSVSSLNYGNKLVMLVVGLGIITMSTAVLPHLSKMVARDDWSGIRNTMSKYSFLILAITIPIVIVFVAFSEALVALMYERGNFTSDDTALVATIQICYAIQIPFGIVGVLGARLMNAMQVNKILMIFSGISLVVNVIGNLVLMRFFGVIGIAASTSIVYFLSACMIYGYLFGNDVFKGNKHQDAAKHLPPGHV